MRLDYPDPFLKGVAAPTPAARSVVRRLPPAGKAEPKRRERVQLSHLATVTAGGQALHIRTIGGRQYELSLRDTAAGFRLTGADRDSLYLEREGTVYGVKTLRRIDETAYDIPRRGRAADGRSRSAGDAHGDAGAAGAVGEETLLFTRTQRLRQARADVESAALLHRLHPDERALTAAGGYLLYDSLPQSRIFVRREPWGLYELLHITTADSLVASSRIVGAEPDPARTLFYADDRTAVTLAGDTRLHGTLRLPQNGLTYGRVGAEFYRGEEVPRTAIRSSAAMLPAPSAAVAARIGALFAFAQQPPAAGDLPDSLGISFRDPTVALRLGTAEIGGCRCAGGSCLAAAELRIDSACRLENVLVCARKITVGSGARIAAQLFARDTVVVEPCAVLEYPSGIYAGRYAELGDVRRRTAMPSSATPCAQKMAASYRQSRTARERVFFMRMARAGAGDVAGVRNSDRPSTSQPQDTTRICSTTLRCSKIPPRRNRCGTAAPRPCAESEAVCVE